ncbi:DEAD/DEAH box helicase family protein [Dysgonomonas termitidis]|uniref:DEAD/DEAH box helicase family protein n=1 Tax=Dysgonomonas termitidis TaxID=1516126 RepID=A0ABV9KRD9_9BACT
MAFLSRSEYMEMNPYDPEGFVSMDELQKRLTSINEGKRRLKLKLLRERNMLSEGSLESRLKKYKESKDPKQQGKSLKVSRKDVQLNTLFKSMSCHEGVKSFEQTLDKYLYELKTHKHLARQYPKAVAFVSKYRNQQSPANCTSEQREKWEKYEKISPAQVLNRLRRIIKRQNIKPEKKHVLRRTQYGYKLKNLANPFSERNTDKYVPLYDLVANGAELPAPAKMTPELQRQYRMAGKNIAKRKREFLRENTQWKDMQRDPVLDAYIDSLTFTGMKQSLCRFNEPQKYDMGLLYQKRYSLLNWQQGSGKTAVLYHFGKYQMDNRRVKNVFVVAPSIAIHMTWAHFLRYNNEKFTIVSRPEHFDNLEEGKFVILSVSMLGRIDDALRLYLKKKSQKACLLFDESDELTSDQSLRTKRTLKCFRRVKYKMLGTGTTTRNYISELFSQFQLLYNSSMNFMCYCPVSYYEDDKRVIKERMNSYYLKPFPPRGGATLFKSCFNPGKASVFGIEKQNQDVYNKSSLWEIIGKAIITRKFREFAGDKYSIHTQTVRPAEGELGVYEKVIKEFFSVVDMYFNTTGDQRKDNSLAIVRQIQLLIKACSVPDLMPGYCSGSLPQKVLHIENMVHNIRDKVAIGCTSLEALEYYQAHMSKVFPERPLFVIKGEISFGKRKKLLQEFQCTKDGILICMQQSLKSSVNIPECNEVILESLQWNIPRMEQFYFRFIRFDSEGHTNVHFVNYSDSIEQNIMALILTKERLNDFIQTGEVTEESALFDEFGVSTSVIDSLFTREQDKEGKFHIRWGEQKIVA